MSCVDLETFSDWGSSSEDIELELEEPLWEDLQRDVFSDDGDVQLDQPFYSDDSADLTDSSSLSFESIPVERATLCTSSVQVCPCCEQGISPTLADFHTHVSSCFLKKVGLNVHQQEQPLPQDDPEENQRIRSTINQIRQSAARLSLSQRINLLQSLGRLARAKNHHQKHTAESSEELSHPCLPSDLVVISLLYKSTQENETMPSHCKVLPDRALLQHTEMTLTPEEQEAIGSKPLALHLEFADAYEAEPSKSPSGAESWLAVPAINKEALTPTHEPEMPLPSALFGNKTPPAMDLMAPHKARPGTVSTNRKRPRDMLDMTCVQSLSFSSELVPADLVKNQRLAL